ncbi:MAG: UbiA family prenyltransferase [Pseudomonadota bacterium]
MADKRPLVLDVDGTFLKTDMLLESFWAGLSQDPVGVIGDTFANIRAPARLKRALTDRVDLPVERLPVRQEILDMAAAARDDGHKVVLASASDERLVARLAKHHGLADGVLGSDGEHNLKGAAKAGALTAAYGDRGFDYAGDASADRPVWDASGVAIIVGNHSRAAEDLRANGKEVVEVSGGWRRRDLIRALRPHQWVKNVLLFLPMIAAHAFDLVTFWHVLVGIAAFCAAASSIYIVNDLLDLDADRRHPTKCKRPFAAGDVPISSGMASCAGLGALALILGASLGWAFLGVVVFYMILSLAYSLKLKRLRWIDIATLASLYTIRVVAGAVASGVEATGYLLAFVFPVFLTLGSVKRLTELTLAKSDERLPGRGYGRPDRGDLLNVAALGTVAALLIFFFYSFSDQALELYPTRWLLWVALIPIAVWLLRMVLLGYAGKQDYDPIVFAMRDRFGIGVILITLSILFYAAGLWAEWFGTDPGQIESFLKMNSGTDRIISMM